jgi:hypothetical protein
MSKKLWIGPYDLLYATGDVAEYLIKARRRGATGVRIFGLINWYFYNKCTPFKEVKKWHPPDAEVKAEVPLYNLDKWNEEYWDRLSYLFGLLDMADMEAHVALHDFCSIKRSGVDRYFHPFISSVQARDTGAGFFDDAMKRWHVQYFERMTNELEQACIPHYLEVMNETGRYLDMTNEQLVNWHGWAVDQLQELGVKKNRIIGSYEPSFGMSLGIALSRQVGKWSVHGHARPEKVLPKYPHLSPHTIVSTDGGGDGDGPMDPIYHWKGPSAKQMKGIAERVMEYGHFGIEYKPRDAVVAWNKWANVDKVDLGIVRAAGLVLGTIPNPTPTEPPTPPEPEPPLIPEPEPQPKLPQSWWKRLLDWIRRLFG